MMRSPLVILVGGAIALALAGWFWWSWSEPQRGSSFDVREPTPPTVTRAAPLRGETSERTALDEPLDRIAVTAVDAPPGDRAASPSGPLVQGEVVCAGSGMPLAAWIEAGEHGVQSHAADGRFRIRLSDESTFRCQAEGYREARIAVDRTASSPIDVGAIELEPAQSVRIRVTDDRGKPLAGATIVAAVAVASNGITDTLDELGTTNADGVLVVHVGTSFVAFAAIGFRTSTPEFCEPGTECHLVVGPHVARLGLAEHGSNLPVAGVALELRLVSRYPEIDFAGRTGADGLFDQPLPPGRYLVRLRSPSVFFGEGAPRALDTPPAAGSKKAELLLGNDAQPRWRTVSQCTPLVVEARDVATRERLTDVTSWIDSWADLASFSTPRWIGPHAPRNAQDGLLSLYDFYLLFEDPSARYRLCVASPGYRTGYVLDPLSTVAPGMPCVVWLEPASTRKLELRTRRGAAYRHEVSVREKGQHVWHGFANHEGQLTAVPWRGGAISIHRGLEPVSRWLADVPRAILEAESTPVIRLDADAEIHVRLAGNPPPPLLCIGEYRASYRPRLVGNELVFDQLPPGRYEVDVPEAFASLELRRARGLAAFPIQLDSGEVHRLAWDEAWALVPETPSGQVTTIGIDPSDVYVVPRWGPLYFPVATWARTRRFPVGPDGSFRLPGVHARPSSLLFVRDWHDGDLMPIGIGTLDEPSVVECAPVTVSFANPAAAEAGLLMQVKFPAVVEGYAPKQWFHGGGSSPFDLGPLPIATDLLRVGTGGKPRDLPLQLHAGEATHVLWED